MVRAPSTYIWMVHFFCSLRSTVVATLANIATLSNDIATLSNDIATLSKYCHSIHWCCHSKGQDDEVNVTLLRPIQDITDHNRDTGELLYNREANDLVVLRSFFIRDNAAL